MSAAIETLQELRARQLANRDRIEATLQRQSRMSDRIDDLAAMVAHLPDVRLTVAQSGRMAVIAKELMRRSGYRL